MLACKNPSENFLCSEDPPPFEVRHEESHKGVILTCEHAGNLLPLSLQDRGITSEHLQEHYAWDIGVRLLTEIISDRLMVPTIFGTYSRLVVDLNRKITSSDYMKAVEKDGHIVFSPNVDVSVQECTARTQALYVPYHERLRSMIDVACTHHSDPVIVSIHSYTPVYKGFVRPWEIGVLWHARDDIAKPLIDSFTQEGFCVGDNEPYALPALLEDMITEHTIDRGLAGAVFEARNDLLQDERHCQRIADILCKTLVQFCS